MASIVDEIQYEKDDFSVSSCNALREERKLDKMLSSFISEGNKKCKHSNIIRDVICSDCGEILNENNTIKFGKYDLSCSGKITKSIIDDMEFLPFPQDVKLKADEIFKKMNIGTKKKYKRTKMLIFLISEAYYLLESPKDPNIIAVIFKSIEPHKTILKGKKSSSIISSTYNDFNYVNTGYESHYSNINAINLIHHHSSILNIDDDIIDEILLESMTIYKKNIDELSELKPQYLSAALILYFCETRGYESITANIISDMCHISINSINTKKKLIEKLDNS